MKRFLLALTKGEIEAVRARLAIIVESGEYAEAYDPRNSAVLAGVVAKIDAAEEMSEAELKAYDYAAGDMMDADPPAWHAHAGAATYNASYRARVKLRSLFRKRPR